MKQLICVPFAVRLPSNSLAGLRALVRKIALPIMLSLAVCFAKNNDKESLTVRAIAHTSQISEQTSTYTTRGRSNTSCSGTGTTINCETTSTPARMHEVTSSTMEVVNFVEANGLRYTISCRASWVGSNCAPLIDGDVFRAEIDGKTMWVTSHKGGNQGKEVRIKNRLLDIRPAPTN
jgi:hypothetical protein